MGTPRPLHVRPADGPSPAKAPPANGPTPPPATWRSARRHPRQLRPGRFQRRRRRGAALPQPAAPGAAPNATRRRHLPGRFVGGGTSAVRHVAADYGHNRRSVSAPTRHYGFARNRHLRFHPRCYYRPDEHVPTETWPAMIASVTDLARHQTGAHRTWLDPGGFSEATLGKAQIDTPRRAMGDLLGHAVRFGVAAK